MPSFFFHLAFDLYAAPYSITSESANALQVPFEISLQQHHAKLEAKTPLDLTAGQNKEHHDKARASVRLYSSVLGGGVCSPERLNGGGGKGALPTVSTITARDWRYDKVTVQTIKMAPLGKVNKQETKAGPDGQVVNGIGAGSGGLATKGRYEPLDPEQDDLGWGIVRLYRDSEETPGLYDTTTLTKTSRNSRSSLGRADDAKPLFRDEDCTTLCILAVPSYLTPSDFLGFVGEKTRDEVSHIRMIRTERGNRYMVLMKFRSGKKAREWRKEWDGKAFDGMEVRLSIYRNG